MAHHRRALPLACALALTLVVQAAGLPRSKFDIKVGLWEMTANARTSGQLPIPEQLLQKLPPERRQQLLEGIQASMSAPHTHRSCLTATRLAEGFHVQEHRSGCQRRVISDTPSELSFAESCGKGDGTHDDAEVHLQRVSREEVTGTVNATTSWGGRSFHVDYDLKGKWLGADCGSVKD